MFTRVGSLLSHWMEAKAMSPMTIFSRYCLQQSMFLNGSRYSLRDVIIILQLPQTTNSVTTILPFNGVSGNYLPLFVPICLPCISRSKLILIASSTALRSSLSVDTNDEVNIMNDNRISPLFLSLILHSQRAAASNPPIHLPISQLHE